ncbi:hypothetical protein MUP01_02975 [Candidatus Bathyarchaeota archaeon]|nr:hypothetical protein [Candidatus Bathyarchaeota archaeon]
MQAKYAEHQVFQKPSNENAKIWRYMDFTKFVSLLERRALFFSRSDKLGDRFEGSYSKANIKLRPLVYKGKIPEQALRNMSRASEEFRRFVIINCWNLSDYESAALWGLYIKSCEGVAVQSTFKRLTQCFSLEAKEPVFIGKVSYIDYKTDWLPEGNIFYPFLHKRKSFAHEQELRAIILKNPPSAGENLNLNQDVIDKGEYVDVNLDTLVENIYVSPTAQGWFLDLVASAMKKYNLKKEPVRSDLASDPVY